MGSRQYDAAGRAINVVGQGGDLTQTQVFDADGARTMLTSQQVIPTEGGTKTETKTQYFVTSSLIGGVVTELDQSGAKTRTFVYQGTQILAWQQQSGTTQTMAWEHRDISSASVRGGSVAAELEPLGMNAGLINPFPHPATRPSLQAARTYPGFADMMSGSQCRVDGIDMPCGMAGGEATVRCPNNDCGPRAIRVTNPDGETRSILKTPFMAFSNGVSGFFMPGWAEMGTPQGQAYAVLAAINGSNRTGMDSSHRQGRGQFANNLLPQNPERPLTEKEVGVIRQKLAGLLTDKCQKFINDLFKAAGSSYSTDILKGFNEVNDASKTGKGGFFFKYDQIATTKDGQPLYAGGTASGVASFGNGQVNLNPGMYSRLDVGTNALYAAYTALHETIHAITGFGDRKLAVAVSTMPGSVPNLLPTDKNDVGANSRYWNTALKAACLPKGY